MRLKEDNTSWKSGGIKRRMYRQAPLTPDEETIRKPSRKYKKKHVHTFERRVIGKTTRSHLRRRFDGSYERTEYETDKVTMVCTGCGYKRTGWY